MGLLDNQVAIITGAAGGIGREVAKLFAAEGASLVLSDLGCARDGSGGDPSPVRAVVESINSQGGQAAGHAKSVSNPDTAAELVELATSRYGQLDILVNAAGIIQDRKLERLEAAAWGAVLSTQLSGTFYCTQAATIAMKKNGGRIVNTTSISGLIGNYGQANFAAADAGVHGLTRTSSIELQRHGIRVNAVAPLAKTRMTEDLPMFKTVDSMRAEHVAPGYLYFASELSEGVTGSVLGIAGGRLSVFRITESGGRFKDADEGVWSAAEIADNWASIGKP